MNILPFFDNATSTLTYLVWDPKTLDAIVIDAVLDFDPLMVDTSTESADAVIAKAKALGLTIHYVLDTHAHADHLSAFKRLREETGAKTAIGEQITDVQRVFKDVFNFPEDFATDGSQWDVLVQEGVVLQAGSIRIEPIHTPGHTPACFSYKIGELVFTGDVLFMPDSGTGRCDFPGGSATDMYRSIQRLFALPDSTRMFVGHDYQPNGRELAYESTIGAAKQGNIHITAKTTEAEFVAFRTARDATLRPPKLIFQSLQVNAHAGELPTADDNGRRYFRMPMGLFRKKA